ncbi:putative expansin-like protein 7 isoform X2 [Apostichopus japonicus]|uniref:Putative expansin-like protein 7 isoform X2 n=1 Tax=Stichopus japonicus TaxID=307972 RepID=A0A2G8K4A4_STIJA|nr:putative expansin-like protein 7 isoform X2 [Apostichopus japonicus]
MFILCQFVKENRDKLFGRAGHCSQKVEKKSYWEKAAHSIRVAGGASERSGGPAADYSPVYEAVLEAMAPQARDGVNALGTSETDPLTAMSESSQDSPAPSPIRQSTLSPTVVPLPQLSPNYDNQVMQTSLQEEIIKIEREKLELARQNLEVQKGILSALQIISAALGPEK